VNSAPVKILYIDDDAGLARLIQRNLERNGFIVEIAPNGETGLKRLREDGFDIIALDHHLPTGTGLDILQAMSDIPFPPPVVYVTASAEPSVAIEALKAGAADYIMKDVSGDFLHLLVPVLYQALEKRRLQAAKERAEQETRRALERAETLLKEVNHRVANSLALVSAMVRMQSTQIEDMTLRNVLDETQNRILAIANIHRCLYTSHDVRIVDLHAYLDGLLAELQATVGDAQTQTHRIHFSGERIPLPTDHAVSLGVIVNELVTNALKYAYQDREDGEIRVGIKRIDDTQALLFVEDDGIGWEKDIHAKGTGLGTRIIKAMATNIGGVMEIAPLQPGTRVTLLFNLASPAPLA